MECHAQRPGGDEMHRSTRLFGIIAVITTLGLLGVPAGLRAQTSNGALKVTSFPSGANVQVDGLNTGKVTPMSVSVAVGTHTVVVAIPNSGWNPGTRTLEIAPGNTTSA